MQRFSCAHDVAILIGNGVAYFPMSCACLYLVGEHAYSCGSLTLTHAVDIYRSSAVGGKGEECPLDSAKLLKMERGKKSAKNWEKRKNWEKNKEREKN